MLQCRYIDILALCETKLDDSFPIGQFGGGGGGGVQPVGRSIRVRCIRGPAQRVPGNVATRINVRYTGMYNRHLDILLPGENAYSMRRKRPNKICSAWRNCIFVWTQLTNVNKCCERNCIQGYTEEYRKTNL